METIFSLIIAVLSILFVAYIITMGLKDPIVELTNDSIKIKGAVFYSLNYQLNEFSAIEIVDTIPAISWRTNGFSLINIHRGHYRTKEKENVLLFVDEKSKPFIYLETNTGKKIYLNFKDSQNTRDCYNAIKNKMGWKNV